MTKLKIQERTDIRDPWTDVDDQTYDDRRDAEDALRWHADQWSDREFALKHGLRIINA